MGNHNAVAEVVRAAITESGECLAGAGGGAWSTQ